MECCTKLDDFHFSRISFFSCQFRARYMNGVSNTATTHFSKYVVSMICQVPAMGTPQNAMTVKSRVSISWLTAVLALFRSQSHFSQAVVYARIQKPRYRAFVKQNRRKGSRTLCVASSQKWSACFLGQNQRCWLKQYRHIHHDSHHYQREKANTTGPRSLFFPIAFTEDIRC